RVPVRNSAVLLVHLHSGSYVFHGGEAGTLEAVRVAFASETPVISVGYRRLPDHPFPAALDDAVAVWAALAPAHDPAATALFGCSAGDGLSMATMLALVERGGPVPGALFLGSPWADLTKTVDRNFANVGVDNVLVTYDGTLGAAATPYTGGTSRAFHSSRR